MWRYGAKNMGQEFITKTIALILQKMGFGESLESVDVREGTTSRVSIRMRNEANMLIGEHGATIAALEHLLKRMLSHEHGELLTFTLDVNDYRLQRLEDLKQDVKGAAKEVRLYRREVPLRPMSSFERRIVHLLLAEYPDITTESVGREPERRVVIKPYP